MNYSGSNNLLNWIIGVGDLGRGRGYIYIYVYNISPTPIFIGSRSLTEGHLTASRKPMYVNHPIADTLIMKFLENVQSSILVCFFRT